MFLTFNFHNSRSFRPEAVCLNCGEFAFFSPSGWLAWLGFCFSSNPTFARLLEYGMLVDEARDYYFYQPQSMTDTVR